MNKIILHIDMNSYFASVEQQANPFLRGKSVGVCAYLSPGGVIIASSIEAKAKGIKTGCIVRDALRLDPKVVLLENEPAKYRSTTESLYQILSSYTDTVEPYSIDEAFLNLNGWTKSFTKATRLGYEIQYRIKQEIGEWLNSSVGISWTRWLAKFASDIAPKKGLLTIDSQEKLHDLLDQRPLTDAWGINTRMESRLKAIGIKDLLDLKNFSPDKLKHALGWYGYYLWANVNGKEITRVSQGSPMPKSIGHSYCLPNKTVDKKYLSTVLYKLCEKTGRRLRAKELEAGRIHIGWAYERFLPLSKGETKRGSDIRKPDPTLTLPLLRGGHNCYGVNRSFKTADKLFTTGEIFKQVNRVLKEKELLMPVRMMAVSVSSLTPVTSQMSLFEDNLSHKDLSRAMDRLNDKYGEYTVARGQMFSTQDIAKDRIGFRKTVAI